MDSDYKSFFRSINKLVFESKKMKTYDNVVEAINDLRLRGFDLDLNVEFDNCIKNGDCLHPDDFEIVETHRFEGNSDPDDEDIVYAMSSITSDKKGIFTGAFGTYANTDAFKLIKNIHDCNNE